MSNLPDKVKRIDILRVDYGCRKLCECLSPHYVIDYENRLVTCSDCNAVVEPFQALYTLARRYERLGEQIETLLEQRKEISNYKPHLVVIKNLEKQYRSNNYSMLPICPRCGEPFDLNELNDWINRKFAKLAGTDRRGKENIK